MWTLRESNMDTDLAAPKVRAEHINEPAEASGVVLTGLGYRRGL